MEKENRKTPKGRREKVLVRGRSWKKKGPRTARGVTVEGEERRGGGKLLLSKEDINDIFFCLNQRRGKKPPRLQGLKRGGAFRGV